MRLKTPEETRQMAINFYRNGKKVKDISNLTGLHVTTLTSIFREEFIKGSLKPRHENVALHHRPPNGTGKKILPSGIGKGGRNKERKKFSAEQEAQIAIEYYEQDLSFSELHAKYGLHPVQLQRIRKTYQPIYGMKKKAPKCYLEKFNNANKKDEI